MAAIYAKHYSSNDPLDPPQNTSQSISESPNTSKDFSFTSKKIEPRRRSQISQFGGGSSKEARNIYYEQELLRSEHEIFELRFVLLQHILRFYIR